MPEQPAAAGLNPQGSITNVPGVKVGHFTHTKRPTGCSVILFEEGAAVGCDFDGSAPGSYQAELLQPVSCVQDIWGVVLSGGSSYGLHTALGVVRYLEERKIGMKCRGAYMPIVAAGIIMDLNVGSDPTIRPDAEGAYQACLKATSGPIEEGTVGGGAGGTVGKMMRQTGGGGMKGGFGTASIRVGDVIIGAAMVLNGVGDIVDWRTGKIIAGARRADGKGFLSINEVLGLPPDHELRASLEFYDPPLGSTTIGVLATNATFDKTEMTKIAMMANCGAARTINPYHTPGDGDILYAASTHKVKSDMSVSTAGALAAQVVAEAVMQGAKMAKSVDRWPAYRDYTLKLPHSHVPKNIAKINRRQFSNRAAASLGLALAHPALSQAAQAKNGASLASAGSLTDVPGIKAGHFTHPKRSTGCTMIIMEEGAATGVDFGGSSHGGQQTILLEPVTSIQSTWGISISGGGAFGMAASWGLIRHLAEHKVGYYGGTVPLITAAVIYDFGIDGDMTIRADAEGGYQASQAASKGVPLAEGNVGAGAGATVGTMLSSQGIHGMKGGVGTASVRVGDLVVGALAVANTAGDIVDWRNGSIIAGARRADNKGFVGIAQSVMKNPPKLVRTSANDIDEPVFQSSVVGVVATNAPFTKTELCKIAINAGAGAARTVNPYHTQGDGNTVFAISTNKVKSDLSLSVIGSLAAEALSLAILRSAMMATSLESWPSYRDYTTKLRRRA